MSCDIQDHEAKQDGIGCILDLNIQPEYYQLYCHYAGVPFSPNNPKLTYTLVILASSYPLLDMCFQRGVYS